MRSTLVTINAERTRATVELRPCWLARLFGARPAVVDLNTRKCWHCSSDNHAVSHWQIAVTGRFLDPRCGNSREGRRILRALEFRPLVTLPEARTVRSGSWLAPGSGE